MPQGTKTDRIYQALKKKGMPPAAAARVAQAKTGRPVSTGSKPRGKAK